MHDPLPKPSKLIQDPSFKEERAAGYHLTVQIGLDGCYLAAIDLSTNKYLLLEEYSFEDVVDFDGVKSQLKWIAEGDDLLKYKYQSISFGLIHHRSTLIPDAVFDENRLEEYLALNFELEEGERYKADRLINLKARNVYVIPSGIDKYITSRWPGVSIRHYATPLIDSLMLTRRGQEDQVAYAHVQYGHFELCMFQGEELKLYNTFHYKTAEDLAYFLLFVFEQLRIDPQTVKVEFLGELDEQSAIYSLIRKYVREVGFGKRSDTVDLSGGLGSIPSHHYYNLFHQFLCE